MQLSEKMYAQAFFLVVQVNAKVLKLTLSLIHLNLCLHSCARAHD